MSENAKTAPTCPWCQWTAPVPGAFTALDYHIANTHPEAGMTVKVLAHRAKYAPFSPEASRNSGWLWFIKVTNLGPGPCEITHIWYGDKRTGVVHILNEKLPAYLQPDQTVETWVDERALPDPPDPNRFEVMDSRQRIHKSCLNTDVPSLGN